MLHNYSQRTTRRSHRKEISHDDAMKIQCASAKIEHSQINKQFFKNKIFLWYLCVTEGFGVFFYSI